VVYLKDELNARFGDGTTHVVLPITDPYVRHHGALGGFARVYCTDGTASNEVLDFVGDLQGIEAVYTRESACREFELPPDREGDVVAVSDANTAIGRSEAEHDLSELQGYRLRSHGGLAERYVPIILSEPLISDYTRRAGQGTLNSYEIFDYAINGV